MSEPDSKRLEFLAGHYRETFSHQREYLSRRDRAFGYALLAGVALAFRVSDLPASDRVIALLLQRLAGQELKLDAGALAVLLWFVEFALVVRYFQTTMTVERQYRYIARVEREMCALYGGDVLARESASYLAKYPKFSDWIHLVYTKVFPLALAFVICWSVVPEFENRGFWSPVAWMAGALAAATLVTIGLFLYSTRWENSDDEPEREARLNASGAPDSNA